MPCVIVDSDKEVDRKDNELVYVSLCRLCTRLEAMGYSHLIAVDPGLYNWWTEHKRQDAQRKSDEAAKQERSRIAKEAAAKLTPEEREALGIR